MIAVLIGGGDLVAVLIDGQFKIGGSHAGAGGVILFSALMLVCAVGMWQLRYWAVLGFQAILAFVILFFSLLGLRAANLLAVLASVCVVVRRRLAVLQARSRAQPDPDADIPRAVGLTLNALL